MAYRRGIRRVVDALWHGILWMAVGADFLSRPDSGRCLFLCRALRCWSFPRVPSREKAFRVVTGIIALLVTIFGVLALYGWKDDYLDSIRLRDEQNHVHQSADTATRR